MKFKKILVTALCCSLVFAQTITADAASLNVSKGSLSSSATYVGDYAYDSWYVEVHLVNKNGKYTGMACKSKDYQNVVKSITAKATGSSKKAKGAGYGIDVNGNVNGKKSATNS